MAFDDRDVTNSLDEETIYDLGGFDDPESLEDTDFDNTNFDDPEFNPNNVLPADEEVSYRDENYDYPDDDILDTEDLEFDEDSD